MNIKIKHIITIVNIAIALLAVIPGLYVFIYERPEFASRTFRALIDKNIFSFQSNNDSSGLNDTVEYREYFLMNDGEAGTEKLKVYISRKDSIYDYEIDYIEPNSVKYIPDKKFHIFKLSDGFLANDSIKIRLWLKNTNAGLLESIQIRDGKSRSTPVDIQHRQKQKISILFYVSTIITLGIVVLTFLHGKRKKLLIDEITNLDELNKNLSRDYDTLQLAKDKCEAKIKELKEAEKKNKFLGGAFDGLIGSD